MEETAVKGKHSEAKLPYEGDVERTFLADRGPYRLNVSTGPLEQNSYVIHHITYYIDNSSKK